MNTKFYKVFRKKENIIIGAMHFPPLLGYPKFPGLNVALKNAIYDLTAFEKGGVDGVIFENNYDNPHKPIVDSSVVASMAILGNEIRKRTKLPLGVNVLLNDYVASLSLAKLLNLQFIRIPVFVDRVKTDCGIIQGNPQEIALLQKRFEAQNITLFTDIHVKHAKLLSNYSLTRSAKLAIKNGSDAIIITGKWTGQAPDIKTLQLLRQSIGDFPILIGSGLTKDNILELFRCANGVIVSTSLKKGNRRLGEVNVKSYNQRISLRKIQDLMQRIN